MSTTNILDLCNRIDELEKNSGGGGSADSAKRSDIATEFNTTTAYTAGCFVYHEGKLYQFNADHAAGAWDPTDVVEANVTDQVVSNKAAIDALGTIPEIVTISATLGTGTSPDPIKIADYPSGFNINNTAIICAQVEEANDTVVLWNGVSAYSAIWTLLMKTDGFYGVWNNTSFNNKPIKITLLKR